MHKVTLKPGAVLALVMASAAHKPKGSGEFIDALAISKAMRSLYEEKVQGDRFITIPTFPADETRDITLEGSAFRLLKTAFEVARDGGAVYAFGHAEMVVAAEDALKGAVELKVDPKPASA